MGSSDKPHKHYHIGYCDKHGKNKYASRKAARAAARLLHPGDRKTSYPCSAHDGIWHYGALRFERDEYRGILPWPFKKGAQQHEREGEQPEPEEAP